VAISAGRPEGLRRPHVGVVLYGDLTFDSRVRREARTLAHAGYNVTIACLADAGGRNDLPPNVTVLVRPLPDRSVVPGAVNPFRARARTRLAALARGVGWLRQYISNLRSWGRAATAACGPVDLWHANDLTGLAAVVPFADRRTPIVYDVHDLMLETGTAVRLPRLARRLLGVYERRLVARVSAIVTVNDGLAGVLRSRFPGKRIEVVHNCPDRWVPANETAWSRTRDAAGIAHDAPVVIYHGGLSAGRGIEEVMDALLVPGLERAHLVLLGFGERRDTYAEMATQPRWAGRVHVLDAVPPSELLSWVTSADVGAVLHPGVRLNDFLKTPNKLFECLAAGVPVVASDFPLMRRIVLDDQSGPLGATADPSRPEAIAAALRSILDLDPARARSLRDRCLAAAQDRWNWEVESARLTRLYGDLLRARS
jgi:glycosyltransferase involved in cell wall biosynthesis